MAAAGMAAWALPLRLERLDLASPAALESAAIFTVEDEVTKPMRISGAPPSYTEFARKQGIQGAVVVRATIDAEGRVVDVVPLERVGGGLTETAMEAISGWRFEPATLDGRPVAVYYNLTVNFRLQ
jgi:protein TonB